MGRAELLMSRKQYGEALEIYQTLLVGDPKNPALLNKAGIACQQQLDFKNAKRYYERAIKIDPKFNVAINNLGTVYYQFRKYKRAVREYKKALSLDPESGSFYSNLGYAYFSLKEYDNAMAAFRRALELDPGLFERRNTAGSLLMERTVGDRGLFFFYLAKSYAQMNNAQRCAEYLRKSRDEGYKQVATAKTDPAFATVRENPLVKEVLDSLTPSPPARSDL